MKYKLEVSPDGVSIRCPVCRHNNAVLLTFDYDHHIDLWKCRDCGFVVPERDVEFISEEDNK
jgi:transcription elongation factor Elf1